MAAVQVGTVVAGRYRIERFIGKGGMGIVALARHVELDEPVALKFLRPELSETPEAVRRFRREGRAAARLRSKHIAKVHDNGMHDGLPYLVMEYLEGESLGTMLSQLGPFGDWQVASYALQVCEALAIAHSRGIVHRDLKPANIFVTQDVDGSALMKVLDFGVSKVMDPERFDDSATTTALMLGSPSFMAPEQIADATGVDHRIDIWALGVSMYRLLSKRKPYRGRNMGEVVAAVLQSEPPPVESLRSNISAEMAGRGALLHEEVSRRPLQRCRRGRAGARGDR